MHEKKGKIRKKERGLISSNINANEAPFNHPIEMLTTETRKNNPVIVDIVTLILFLNVKTVKVESSAIKKRIIRSVRDPNSKNLPPPPITISEKSRIKSTLKIILELGVFWSDDSCFWS